MTTNAVLAEQLHAQADDAMHHRKILLCASVALTETNTAAAAVKVLGDWHGADSIEDAAIEVLEQLALEHSAKDG